MNKVLSFVAIGLCVVTLMLSTWALVMNRWQVYEDTHTKIRTGLFRICVESGSEPEICTSLDETVSEARKTSLTVVKAMIYSAIALGISSIICAALDLTVMRKRQVAGYFASFLAVLTGVFLLVGFAYYAAKLHQEEYEYHVAFALAAIGWIFSWAAGVLIFSEKYFMRKWNKLEQD